ncbi:MAG: glycosyltransferase family 2 protein [Legionellales bacterium]|nr:glycosyltransferase family 2 protein [Legionellales bacterium]
MAIKISIVVPVYNESAIISTFVERTEKTLSKLNISYEIIFCLDPSSDNTKDIICNLIEQNKNIKLLKFSRRFGQPAATMAGIVNCTGEHCVVIDVDLQDPPELIYDLYKKQLEGYDVVIAKRSSRKGETWMKKCVAYLGYYLINKVTSMNFVNIPRNSGDFRIMSRKVVDYLKQYEDPHNYLRGLVAYIGFKQTFIEYERDSRFKGKSKYNQFIGSIKDGMIGVVGFSTYPLLAILLLGVSIIAISIILFIYNTILPPIYTFTTITVLFFFGIHITILGIIAEYIGRIYDVVKKRHAYIIDEKINF